MWVFVLTLCLLDQSRASPLPWEQSSLQPELQQQVYQTTPYPNVGQRRTSSSSSSSSSSSASSASSESSQSSEGLQQLRERQRLENMAVEQVDSSQESLELLPSNSSLWINELVLLGQRAGEQEGERDMADDSAGSAESRQRTLLLTFHPLMARPRLPGGGADHAQPEADPHLSGNTVEAAGTDREEGGVRGAEEEELPQHPDDSTEKGQGLTFDSPDHAHNRYYGNEAELELGL